MQMARCGPASIQRQSFQVWMSIVKIRRSWDSLIFIMESLYWEDGIFILKWPLDTYGCLMHVMTSSNGNIFHVTGHSPVNSPHKGQWRGALMFSFICINGWVNNREAVDLRRHRAPYDVTVMKTWSPGMDTLPVSKSLREGNVLPKEYCGSWFIFVVSVNTLQKQSSCRWFNFVTGIGTTVSLRWCHWNKPWWYG